jgi:antitoxin component of RelBE/YafQ-DinJ toxin-antitoxin module
MGTITITHRLDSDLAAEFKDFAKESGLTVNSLINVLISQTLKTRRVVIEPDLIPTPYLQKAIKEVESDYKAGRVNTFTNKSDLMAHLRSL